MAADLAMMPAHALARLFKKGKASPVEAAKAALARIASFNPVLNCMQHVDADGALAQAKASEKRWGKGKPLGPLDGVPTTIKDMIQTSGMPTRMGSAAIGPEGPWETDAPVTARLRQAGAVLLGKTTSPEYGWKGVTDSKLYGITRNPWDIHKTPGGSSGGGTAAEAVGIGNLAMGTDGAGSVRIPCSFTGLFGLKPTFARVPLYPPSAQGTLSNAGPMTRTVRDAALMMNVIARPDARDWYAIPTDDSEDYLKGLEKGVKGMRIAYSPDLGFVEKDKIDPEVAKSVANAARMFKKLGAKVVEVSPRLNGLDPRDIENVHWTSNFSVMLKSFPPEKQALMDPGLLRAAEHGSRHSLEAYIRAGHQRVQLGVIFNHFFEDYDLLLTPTMPMPAFNVGEPAAWGGDGLDIGWTPFTLTFNLTRHPAATIPCGTTKAGLPIGLQIVGPLYADARVLRAAHAFEEEMPIAPPPMAARS
ncbi:amidase [Vineibacter terrae]|uniref:amidase n=1 Tax=Vineibacter terrae TaxID=2586908 RepID=UPI002E3101B2|nr:amidase [Vineibacter terrae]HEX2889143.1 amidase [Vineibacter terrae]